MPTAIVTGGNSGIGRSISVALAKSGFDIGFTWHSEEERAEEAAQEIIEAGARAMHSQVDLHDVDAGLRVFEDMVEVLGEIDVLVNNAGYGSSTPIVEMELDEFRGVVDVDLIAPFTLMKAAARRMIDQGRGGRIVNITSVHEHIPKIGSGPYVAAKHGLGGLTKVAALELAEHGITVNAVAPGQIATRMTGQEDQEPDASEGIPLGRAGKADEIASAVAWLASPGASYVTGESIVIDGGLRHISAEHQ